MSDRVAWLVQGAVGVACIVLAVVFLPPSKPELQLAYTAVSGFGFSLLGNLRTGPGQLSAQEAAAVSKQGDVK